MQVHHVYAPIAALGLSTVRLRLMHPRAGLGWSEGRTLAAESAYRKFLLFAKMYPAETPRPTADVDAFWHFHILDTVKYARDCASAFGYFLHHKPDVEFDDDDQQEELADEAGSAAAYCALARPLEAGAAAYCAAAKPSAYCALTQVGRAKNGGVLRSSRTRKGLLRSRRPAVIRLATVRADWPSRRAAHGY